MHVTNNRDPFSSAIAATPPAAPPKPPSRPEPPPGPQPGATPPSPPAGGQAAAEQFARLDDHIRQLDQALTQLAGSLPPPPGGGGPATRVNKIEAITVKQRIAENGTDPAQARKHISGVKYEGRAAGGAGEAAKYIKIDTPPRRQPEPPAGPAEAAQKAFIKIEALRDAGTPVEGARNAFLKIERREAGGGATLVNPELHRPPTV